MLKFLGKFTIEIVIALSVAVIVTIGITIYNNSQSYDITGKWRIKIDYEIFFSTHISYFKNCRLVADGDLYIVNDNESYKGLSFLEISLIPETLNRKQKFISLVLTFDNFRTIENNQYEGKVDVILRNADTEAIENYILPFLTNTKNLSIPASYSFSFTAKSDKVCKGNFNGVLKDGTETTRGELSFAK